jgi:UDP-GlcNAc:undecaprenyl-phosphate GlcNAc-1-phosphate transferase
VKTYLIIFLLAAGSSLLLTPLVRRLCVAMGWLDEVRDERRVHKKPVPRLGGVAIFLSLVISLIFLPLRENLLTQALYETLPRLWPIIAPAALIFCCGVYDDLVGVNARFKFVAQIIAGSLFYFLGGRIEGLAFPVLGVVVLPSYIGFVVTVIWVVAITNAFNLLDGLDGLAAGAALFASLVMLVVSYQMGHPLIMVLSLALCGSLAGFLRYNFNPASIFLGDSGSLLLGFLLSALAVQGAQKASTAVALTIPLIAFGLPVFDTAFSLVRRFISGKPLFAGDREHVHHKLLERGWSQRKVVLSLYGVCALSGLTSLLFFSTSPVTGFFLAVIGIAVIMGVSRLRYHELDEFQAGVRRNSLERRERVANNVCIRRAGEMMAQAQNFSAFVKALEAMLAHKQFALCKLWVAGDDASPRWTWLREDVVGEDGFHLASSWHITIPLVAKGRVLGGLELFRRAGEGNLLLDVNLLCRLFARETARAWERLEAKREEGEKDTTAESSVRPANARAAVGFEGRA